MAKSLVASYFDCNNSNPLKVISAATRENVTWENVININGKNHYLVDGHLYSLDYQVSKYSQVILWDVWAIS